MRDIDLIRETLIMQDEEVREFFYVNREPQSDIYPEYFEQMTAEWRERKVVLHVLSLLTHCRTN